MFVWSKIDTNNRMFRAACAYMAANNHEYHNINHVAAMYQYLHDTNEPYSEALDWAVLFHDVVYDNQPDKEDRSAELFVDLAIYYGMEDQLSYGVEDLIIATKTHVVEQSWMSPIVRADLHALANKESTRANAELIKRESKRIYNLSDEAWAEATIFFMKGLAERVLENAEHYDVDHRDFYMKVYDGCVETINIALNSSRLQKYIDNTPNV